MKLFIFKILLLSIIFVFFASCGKRNIDYERQQEIYHKRAGIKVPQKVTQSFLNLSVSKIESLQTPFFSINFFYFKRKFYFENQNVDSLSKVFYFDFNSNNVLIRAGDLDDSFEVISSITCLSSEVIKSIGRCKEWVSEIDFQKKNLNLEENSLRHDIQFIKIFGVIDEDKQVQLNFADSEIPDLNVDAIKESITTEFMLNNIVKKNYIYYYMKQNLFDNMNYNVKSDLSYASVSMLLYLPLFYSENHFHYENRLFLDAYESNKNPYFVLRSKYSNSSGVKSLTIKMEK